MQPKVSIVIPVYNGANYMREAIESALAQTYENCEVIVINDGSQDDGATERTALSYGERIRYFAKPNGGVASALNLGIEKMEGEYFSWLSHDDVYAPDKVRAQMACYETLPADTVLYSGYEFFWEDGRKAPQQFDEIYSLEKLNTSLFPVYYGLLNGCSMLIHRSHFARVGDFDERLLTTQDYDMWFRILRGAKVHYCPEVHLRTRQHDAQGSRVIPGHLAEASTLLIRLMGELSYAQMCEISGTPREFYRHMQTLCAKVPYEEAARFAQEQLEALPAALGALEGAQKDGLLCALMDSYDSLQAEAAAKRPVTARALPKTLLPQPRFSLRGEGFGGTLRRVMGSLLGARHED